MHTGDILISNAQNATNSGQMRADARITNAPRVASRTPSSIMTADSEISEIEEKEGRGEEWKKENHIIIARERE